MMAIKDALVHLHARQVSCVFEAKFPEVFLLSMAKNVLRTVLEFAHSALCSNSSRKQAIKQRAFEAVSATSKPFSTT